MLTKRVPVLFEDSEYSQLGMLAQMRGESVGSLIRNAVYSTYFGGRGKELLLRKIAYEKIKKWQKKIGIAKGKIDYKELINYGRKW